MSRPITPILLCGGPSPGFWPLARDNHPAALLPLIEGKSLLQMAARSVADPTRFSDPLIVTSADQIAAVEDQIEGIGSILIEPAARGSAPMAGIAALALFDRDPDALLLLLPADHELAHPERLGPIVDDARASADQGEIVALVADETPTDILLLRADSLLALLANAAPDIAQAARKSFDAAGRRGTRLYPEPKSYAQSPVGDLGQLAPHSRDWVRTWPLDAGWTRIDGWDALYARTAQGPGHNSLTGRVITHDSSGCLIRSDGPTVAALGLNDLILIAAGDVILIAPRNRSDEIGALRASTRDDSEKDQ